MSEAGFAILNQIRVSIDSLVSSCDLARAHHIFKEQIALKIK
jgi:hypothetical protein